jgi:hypothetical protein
MMSIGTATASVLPDPGRGPGINRAQELLTHLHALLVDLPRGRHGQGVASRLRKLSPGTAQPGAVMAETAA